MKNTACSIQSPVTAVEIALLCFQIATLEDAQYRFCGERHIGKFTCEGRSMPLHRCLTRSQTPEIKDEVLPNDKRYFSSLRAKTLRQPKNVVSR